MTPPAAPVLLSDSPSESGMTLRVTPSPPTSVPSAAVPPASVPSATAPPTTVPSATAPPTTELLSAAELLIEASDKTPLVPWQQLYETHADFVWRNLLRMGLTRAAAEDALHEVFLVAERRRDTYDSTRGTEKNWLFGIAANLVRSQRRKDARYADASRAPGHTSTSSPDERTSVDGRVSVERQQLRSALALAIESLDPKRRAVFCMFELEGLDCTTIATELEIPVGTVYSRLNTARGALQQELADYATSRRNA